MVSNSAPGYIPSLLYDPANKGTLAGAFSFAINKIILGLDNRLPAQVIAYNSATKMANIQIMIPMVTTKGDVVSRGQIAEIPVQIDGGGNFFIHFPLKTGDFGWIEACDRDISLFLQTLKETAPNTRRKWSFSDAKFTPCQLNQFTIEAVDADSLLISSLDGTVKISMSLVGIAITAPGITFNCPVTFAQGFTGLPGGSGGSIFQGNLQVEGAITASGPITPDTPPP